MAKVIQIGLGSGGMAVLDMLLRFPGLDSLALIEPDILETHNLERHLFTSQAVGKPKLDTALEWVRTRRKDIEVQGFPCWLEDANYRNDLEKVMDGCAAGICAVDNDNAKYLWCSMMRKHKIPWTLGEVLSGGIGGFVHVVSPDGPCYGCISSYLKRENTASANKKPDYSNPEGMVKEARIPASFAAINTIASLHALGTLELLQGRPDYGSFLFPMEKIDGVFREKWQATRLGVAKNPGCLFCGIPPGDIPDADAQLQRKLAELS
ncbi:MAG: ThiF family adenylyltransferase [Gemmataceae bacterium]|nr:ThiF family adenylyltransferase [Gemmataceae bacterium]